MLKYAKLRELTHSHISVQLKPIACVDQCLLGKIKDIKNINAFHGILTHLHCDVSCRQDIELVITSNYYSTHYQLINYIFTSSIIITVLILKKSVTVVEVWKANNLLATSLPNT